MSSDAGRKDLSSKIGDKVTPDASKSTVDKVGDKATGVADKVARDAVPDSHKSAGQSVQDKVAREKEAHTAAPATPHAGGVGDKIKDVFHHHKH